MSSPSAASARPGPIARREAFVLVTILLAGGALRLAAPGLSQFRLDEAHITSLALDVVEGRDLPVVGTQSSVGVYLPPLADYIYALPLAFWRSPLAAVLLTGTLNLAAVALAWATARRWWGPTAGLATAALLAANPWAVMYSRQVWQPDLLPPLGMACVACGLAGFLDGRRGGILAHLALLAAAANTHFTGALLVPITVALAVVGRRHIRWEEVAGGLALGGAISAPYLQYLWRDRVTIAEIVSNAADSLAATGDTMGLWRLMLTGDGAHALLGEAAPSLGAGGLLAERVAAGVVLALIVAGAGAWVGRALRGPCDAATVAGLVVTLWTALPLVVFGVLRTPVHIHYMAVALPGAPLVAGSLMCTLRGLSRRWPARLGTWLCGAAAALQAGLTAALLATLAARATPGGFAMPLGQQARAVREARALSREVITLVPGDNATSDEWAAVLAVQLRGTPHRLVDGRHAALLPVRDTALIVAPGAEMGLSTYTLLGAVEDLREIPGRAGEAPLLVARLRAGMDLGLEPVPAPSVLANGVELLGYRVEGNPSPGETFTWRVAWRVSAPWYSASRTYHIYNHLLAADGTRVAQADSGTLPTSAWQVGDVVMQAFALAVPASAGPGPYAVRVGMYTFPELENQPLLDAAGAPAGDGVTFGPLAPS